MYKYILPLGLLAFSAACSDDAPPPEKKAPLRDRMELTKVEEKASFWSTANTLEERQEKIEGILEKNDSVFVLDMHDMGGWEFDELLEDPFPSYIRALDGKEIITRGFMMPDIDFEHIQKFHLVRSLYSCCFGAPPQLNEVLRVELTDAEGMDYTYNTIEVRGILRVVFEMEDGLVEDLLRLENATYRVLDFEDPGAPVDFDAATGFQGVVPDGDVY
ncbi:MAG TPA: hypothetical protein EYN86_03000 [Planctomycetes bacterium]|jgi:hypothetical protein|nr:hypothetical protein [Planctomycetota bacterium]